MHTASTNIVAVSSEGDAINHVTAFFIALEYLGVMIYSKFTKVNGKITGGALSYLGELEKRRQMTLGLQFLVLADETFREKVHDLIVADRATFGTYSEASDAAMTEHTIILQSGSPLIQHEEGAEFSGSCSVAAVSHRRR